MTPIEMGLLLFAGHAFADFPLQTDFIARGKNRNRPPQNIPPGQKPMTVWPYMLTAHATIHGTFVGIITGIWWLGIAEAVAHWCIDFGKCENWYGIHADQIMHYVAKACWLSIAIWIGATA